MALSDYAKKAALNIIEATWRLASPQADLSDASPVRHLFLVPLATLAASFVQEIESLESLSLGSADRISETDYDTLKTNFPSAPERRQGSRATVTVRVYLSGVIPLDLRPFPYFSADQGTSFSPVEATIFSPLDIRRDEQGALFVDVNCIATDFGVTADAGQITQWVNLPREVTRVTNLAPTSRAESRATNADDLAELSRIRSDGSRAQLGGLVSFVQRAYPAAQGVRVVSANDPDMWRDEVFSVDGVTPNLDRLVRPLAPHVDLGLVDFDAALGRAVSLSASFTPDMVGARVEIAGDEERYRLITAVLSDEVATFSGAELTGQRSVLLWARGPKTLATTDVYAYFSSLFARQVVVDRRQELVMDGHQAGDTVLFARIAPGRLYDTLLTSGTLMVDQGSITERRIDINFITFSNGVLELNLVAPLAADIAQGTQAALWPDTPIRIAPDGDIRAVPALYVAQVEQLDPITLEVVKELDEVGPTDYSAPGYYISSPDGAAIFSAREDKLLVLATKRSSNAFLPYLSVQGGAIIGSSQVGGQDIIQRSGHNFTGFEGRRVTLEVPQRVLNQPNLNALAVSSVSPKTLELIGANVLFFTEDGVRTAGVLVTVSSPTSAFGTFTITSVTLSGNTLTRTDPGVFFAGVPADFEVSITFTPLLPRPAYELEAVVIQGQPNQFEVLVQGGLRSVSNGTTVLTGLVTIRFDDERGTFDTTPVRVVYYTHPDIERLQLDFDEAGQRIVSGDTLARSYLPALVDITMRYRGRATPEQLTQRFAELLGFAVRETPEDEDAVIDVSDILSALNDEGFASSFQTDPEVRVQSYLSDGEYVVRYLNPSRSTRQQMAHTTTIAAGQTRVQLRAPDALVPPPSRGRVILGGLDPARQEVMAYEGVVDIGQGVYLFIFRAGNVTQHAHTQWEPAWVGVRDWEPRLEFSGGALVIPSTCRPYLRQAVFIKVRGS